VLSLNISSSTGIGRDLTLLALKRGDKVIATARGRSLSKLEELKAQGADTLELDVGWPLERLQQLAKDAVAIHGRVDVLVNNAGMERVYFSFCLLLIDVTVGYFLVGALEENSAEETLQQFKCVAMLGLCLTNLTYILLIAPTYLEL